MRRLRNACANIPTPLPRIIRHRVFSLTGKDDFHVTEKFAKLWGR